MTTTHPVTVPDARPYAWPCIAPVPPHRLALVIIDMQKDFVLDGLACDQAGRDLSATRSIIPALTGLLAAARESGTLVVHVWSRFGSSKAISVSRMPGAHSLVEIC